jgi:hypothetical protein
MHNHEGWIIAVTATETCRGQDDPLIWRFAMLDRNRERALRTMRERYRGAARVEVVAPFYA